MPGSGENLVWVDAADKEIPTLPLAGAGLFSIVGAKHCPFWGIGMAEGFAEVEVQEAQRSLAENGVQHAVVLADPGAEESIPAQACIGHPEFSEDGWMSVCEGWSDAPEAW